MTVKVKGVPFDFGGEKLVIPPIGLGALEQLQRSISEFKGDARDSKQLATVIDAAHAALKRNYPEMTREQVGNMIDLGNFIEVFECVMDVSSMRRKAIESGELTGN
jgi:hypothetical protein